jgi:hypothetical protein
LKKEVEEFAKDADIAKAIKKEDWEQLTVSLRVISI